MSGINCPSCNNPAPHGAVFCDHCGYDLRTLNSAPSAPLPQVPAAPVAAEMTPCPVCLHANPQAAMFCENCGAQLSALLETSRQVPVMPADETLPDLSEPLSELATDPGGLSGRLVILEGNISLPIPSGKSEVVIGREDPVSGVFPDIDLDPLGGHEAGVGRRHAQLLWRDGQAYLEDLESVNGTALNHQRLTALQPQPLKDGDEIRLGKMILIYYR
jgi:hypothetical protein